MNWQSPRDYQVPCEFDPFAPRRMSDRAPIVSETGGIVEAIERNPFLWGAAVALSVSGILGMVTL